MDYDIKDVKSAAMDVKIDKLTEEQEEYLVSWTMGP